MPDRTESAGTFIESNAALARRIVAQDAHAFATLVDRYHDFVYRICFGILRHRQDAEDATQDTFSRLARYLDRWDPRRPLEPWLATVASNRSRSQLSKRRVHSPLALVDEPQTTETPRIQAADAIREEITLAMGKLAARQRIAFELFHEQSMSYGEIAKRMDCPVGTVKTLVHRARQSLIDHLSRRNVIVSDENAGAANEVDTSVPPGESR